MGRYYVNLPILIKVEQYCEFSVTCNEYEWIEGSMELMLSTYGSGLEPAISVKEFESDN